MRSLHRKLKLEGVDSYVFWGRRHETINDHEQCCASKLGVYSHGILARITDRCGFYSKKDTARLLKKLDDINPDVVHLHNIHGYYINIRMLFEWLESHRCHVKWTLHDCWAITGHCPYFDYVGCSRWRAGCYACPQKKGYPKSVLFDASRRNWEEKKALFTLIPEDRMTLVAPSEWLAHLVQKSFLSNYKIIIRRNEIDTTVFRPTKSNFREISGVGNRTMVLGVASPWTPRKGLDDLFLLAKILDPEKYAVVAVGLNDLQLRRAPSELIGLKRTDSANELVSIYTASDVFFNPTREDNYPTVNLEAEACGAAVVTYDTGGCRETIKNPLSVVVNSLEEARDAIELIANHKKEAVHA